ncbi:A24 family peptidase [Planctomicrobium sp. SH668]|uniref:A24 family peptidase n=1 Tax=Planctomicrobium sp. SH668 TaxID=3448126 RepID=UPI003F5C293E
MNSLSPPILLLILAVSVFTAAAAYSDFRSKRIPNKLTLPMFFAGWVYQIVMSFMYGWEHLGSAALGFLVGFGFLFVLWFVGGSGGGDVKLVGALSVWLGFQMTLAVIFVTTVLVLLGTSFIILKEITTKGMGKTREKYLATGKTKVGQPAHVETRDDKVRRRVMGYAPPVAIATWLVVIWYAPRLERALHPETANVSSTVEQR